MIGSSHFIEHLTCFVSRAQQSGGVETIQSFSVTKQLLPLVPTQLVASSRSMASLGSHLTSRGSASSNSFGVASCDGFLTQDNDAFSPTTGDSVAPNSLIPCPKRAIILSTAHPPFANGSRRTSPRSITSCPTRAPTTTAPSAIAARMGTRIKRRRQASSSCSGV